VADQGEVRPVTGSGARASKEARAAAPAVTRRELRRPGIFLAFAIGIFLLLYVGVLALQWSFLWRQAVDDARDNARTLTEALVLELSADSPLTNTLEQLREPGRYEALDRIMRVKLGKFGLIKSKIYDLAGRLVYADDPGLVGRAFTPRTSFEAALAGGVASRVVSAEQYGERYGLPAPGPMVETYLPLTEAGRVVYVFEAYQDFAPARARLWRMMAWSGALLAVIVGAALVGLAWAYRWIHLLQAHVQSLERLLPICSTCKKIRVEAPGEPLRWVSVEDYFGPRDRLAFTHGMCPECVAKFKAQLGEPRGSDAGAVR